MKTKIDLSDYKDIRGIFIPAGWCRLTQSFSLLTDFVCYCYKYKPSLTPVFLNGQYQAELNTDQN